VKTRLDRKSVDELTEGLRDLSAVQLLTAWPQLLEQIDARAKVEFERVLEAVQNFGPLTLGDYLEKNPISPALLLALHQRLPKLRLSEANQKAARSKNAGVREWVQEEFELHRDDYATKQAFAEAYREKLLTGANPFRIARPFSVFTISQRWLPKAK